MTDMSWMPWVVGGVMVLSFLYMKVWPFVRTIIRTFRGPRFKSKSKLSVEQYKKLSIGSLYALQQGGYLNTLSLDIKDKLPTILGEWWGINNAHDAAKHWMICAGKVTITTFRLFMRLFCLTMKMRKTIFSSRTWRVRKIMKKLSGNCKI